ncbi:diaminobutyrate acetyltransferase [Thalassolituus sp.]|jgi:L-2,4-diaminobutyric acid acetyltransferase|uniref:diaminobutyrate acetyltransferase n=1 Tax=Thalassolituus sp. TaxID=2030822 RepID=UPI002EC9690B|nr:diaminobutyrate acetyltransferase [Pseudomonadota bacterium]
MNQILAQAAPNEKDQSQRLITMRKPNPEDGADVNALVERCKPLDTNSMYCNLLQCSHFRDTAVLAEEQGEMIGFISGYRLPEQADTLFVWQVAVSEKARGLGLASKMLLELLGRQETAIRHLHTSITPGNDASWNLFKRLARTLDAPLNERVMFDKERHFAGHHDTEMLVHIGPFDCAATTATRSDQQ